MTYRKNFLFAILAVLASIAGFALLIAAAHPAGAAEADKVLWNTCPNLKDWQPNEDEQDRRPTATPDGVLFEGDQLIHHPVAMDLKDVHPGTYETVGDGPSLTSFFSIEVFSTADPHGYATLRYETAGEHAGQWNIGGTDFYNADPVELAVGHARSTNVVSFGIGYVAHPADGTPVTVDAVQFHGVTYDLTCKPASSPSPSGSNPHHVSTTPNPPANGPQLPVTGPNWFVFAAAATGFLAFGGVLLLAARRRRDRFIP